MRSREHVPRLRLIPGAREPMPSQIRGKRGEPSRNVTVPLEIEALHQCGAIEPFVRMVDEEIEQPPWRPVADGGVGPHDVRLIDSSQIIAPARFRCQPVGWLGPAAQRRDHLARDLAEDRELGLRQTGHGR